MIRDLCLMGLAVLASGLAACADPAPAVPQEQEPRIAPVTEGAWTLDPAASRLSYVSIKAGEIAETNRFDALSGTISPDGTATIEVDLASVDTANATRDERMRDLFFNVAENPKAVITAKINPASFSRLEVGETITRPLKANVALKGIDQEIETQAMVTRVSLDRVLVVPGAPVIISTDMFGLTDELGELRALAELPSISPAVPVTFALAFTRQAAP